MQDFERDGPPDWHLKTTVYGPKSANSQDIDERKFVAYGLAE